MPTAELTQDAEEEKDTIPPEVLDSMMEELKDPPPGIFTPSPLYCFVLFCFVLFCFVLFCFVLFCFVLFCFVLFCFVLFCFVLFCFVLFCFVLFCFILLHLILSYLNLFLVKSFIMLLIRLCRRASGYIPGPRDRGEVAQLMYSIV